MMGRKMHLEWCQSYLALPITHSFHGGRRGSLYLNSKNKAPTTNANNLTVQCSALINTFHRQYMKAAIQRNHSRRAASMTTPMMDV